MQKPIAKLTVLGALIVAFSAQAAFVVQPVSGTESGNYNGRDISNAIDGSGLSASLAVVTDAPVPATWPTHNNNWADEWWEGGDNGTPWMGFDLGDVYEISGLYLWNDAADGAVGGQGIKSFTVKVSSDATEPADWSLISSIGSFSAAAGEATTVTGEEFTLGSAADARWVRIDIASVHGNQIGSYSPIIGEIRFIAIPEPGSLALGLLGLGAVILRRRRA